MMAEVDLRLTGGSKAALDARRSLDALAESLSAGLFEDVRLLVTELVTNSIKHAGLAEQDPVYVRVETSPAFVRVEVVDEGPGFEPARRTRPLTEPFGWGLYLVDRLTDRWGVDSEDGNKTRVWFEIDRR